MINVSVAQLSNTLPNETLNISIRDLPVNQQIYSRLEFTENGIAYANLTGNAASLQLQIGFKPPGSTEYGTYTDTITVSICHDNHCNQPLQGSPLTVTSTYRVRSGAQPEAGMDNVPVLSRKTLAHNVVDAEYSKALDAVIMGASQPRNALYVYDVTTGAERELVLNKPPKAVSVAPNGLKAAVGHDALVTYVDLQTAGQGGAPTLLNVSSDIFDLVLDGRGYVHAVERNTSWSGFHSIHVASNTEAVNWGYVYGNTSARLHPTGDYIYTANNGLSPSDIAKYDITNGAAIYLYDSPYHGDHEMCGNVWMSTNGATLYTACGNTFRSSTNQTQDMLYTGRMDLSMAGNNHEFQVISLSHSEPLNQIALVEGEYQCRLTLYSNAQTCITHLNLHESQFLGKTVSYSLPPVAFGDDTFQQRGMFVFHSADGTHIYLLSYAHGIPDVTASYYLTMVQ